MVTKWVVKIRDGTRKGWYLGDIVVGDIRDIINHNVTSVQNNKKILWKKKKKATCDIVVDQCHQCHQPLCHQSATPILISSLRPTIKHTIFDILIRLLRNHVLFAASLNLCHFNLVSPYQHFLLFFFRHYKYVHASHDNW